MQVYYVSKDFTAQVSSWSGIDPSEDSYRAQSFYIPEKQSKIIPTGNNKYTILPFDRTDIEGITSPQKPVRTKEIDSGLVNRILESPSPLKQKQLHQLFIHFQ